MTIEVKCLLFCSCLQFIGSVVVRRSFRVSVLDVGRVTRDLKYEGCTPRRLRVSSVVRKTGFLDGVVETEVLGLMRGCRLGLGNR